MMSMLLGVLTLLATVWMKYYDGRNMTRNPLLHLGIMLELVGVQLISMGLIGEVLARTYFESQEKSSYVVQSTLNMDAPAQRSAA